MGMSSLEMQKGWFWELFHHPVKLDFHHEIAELEVVGHFVLFGAFSLSRKQITSGKLLIIPDI